MFNSSHTTQDLTFEDPYLNADYTVSGVRFRGVVVDVSTQSVQRYATFTVPFGTCDFRAAQTAANFNFDTFSAQTHCVLYSTLHSTTEHNATFQLRSDAVSNQFSVQFRLTNFGNIDLCRNASDIRYDLAQFFYVFAFLTDNDTRASSVNGHTDALSRTLDNDARYRRFSQLFS
ncbi:hypothetical protein DR72_4522 [Klebsiella aerogenes]|nr:hypothetical protein DR72_4522 [Klebsiella aerogenes]